MLVNEDLINVLVSDPSIWDFPMPQSFKGKYSVVGAQYPYITLPKVPQIFIIEKKMQFHFFQFPKTCKTPARLS